MKTNLTVLYTIALVLSWIEGSDSTQNFTVDTYNDWYVRYSGADDSTHYLDGMVIHYDIAKNKTDAQMRSTILDENCFSEDDSGAVIIINKTVNVTSDLYYDDQAVAIGFNVSQWTNSTLYSTTSNTTGAFHFCIRSELLLIGDDDYPNGLSITFEDLKIYLDINLLANFSLPHIELESNSTNSTSSTKSNEAQVTVSSLEDNPDLYTCICSNQNCVTDPIISPGEFFDICVTPVAVGSEEITSLESLYLDVDGVPKYQAMSGGVSNEVTTYEFVGPMDIITTKMPFLFDKPKAAKMIGDVILTRNSRHLQKERSGNEGDTLRARFQVLVFLEPKMVTLTESNAVNQWMEDEEEEYDSGNSKVLNTGAVVTASVVGIGAAGFFAKQFIFTSASTVVGMAGETQVLAAELV